MSVCVEPSPEHLAFCRLDTPSEPLFPPASLLESEKPSTSLSLSVKMEPLALLFSSTSSAGSVNANEHIFRRTLSTTVFPTICPCIRRGEVITAGKHSISVIVLRPGETSKPPVNHSGFVKPTTTRSGKELQVFFHSSVDPSTVAVFTDYWSLFFWRRVVKQLASPCVHLSPGFLTRDVVFDPR